MEQNMILRGMIARIAEFYDAPDHTPPGTARQGKCVLAPKGRYQGIALPTE